MIAAAWRARSRAARGPDPSARAGPYRCGSGGRRSWCSRPGRGMTPSRLNSTARSNRAKWKIFSTRGIVQEPREDPPAVAPPFAICTTSAVPSPRESCTTHSRSRCGLSPRVSVRRRSTLRARNRSGRSPLWKRIVIGVRRQWRRAAAGSNTGPAGSQGDRLSGNGARKRKGPARRGLSRLTLRRQLQTVSTRVKRRPQSST